MSQSVAVIPGDGVGPEVTEAAVAVLEATAVPLKFSWHEAGDGCLARHGVALPPETLAAALGAQAVLFGAVGETAAAVILPLRRALETHVNLRPARAYPGIDCLHPATDLVVVRENSECLYAGMEHTLAPGVTTATRLITASASTRIAQHAFDYAAGNGYAKVTAIHKANVLKTTDGLFLDCARRVAESFPSIAYEEQLVDSAATLLVLDPTRFQVLLTPNLYGDILSDLAAGLIGGLGLCPSANLGEAHALFEPVHGTAPDIAGKGLANPTAAILCGAMLLEHLGHLDEAQTVRRALSAALAAGQTTPDLGGKLSTLEAAKAVTQRF